VTQQDYVVALSLREVPEGQLPAGTDLYLILVVSVACGSRSDEGADSLFTSRLGSQ
jgi:hypothetical protein